MKKRTTSRIQDLLGLLHTLYSPALAEEWDNVGLQVGDQKSEVTRVLISLDPTLAALEEAERIGAQALLTHHPLIFRPLKHIAAHDETGQLAMRAIRSGIAVIAAHTNLDRAANGLNDWLARAVGIEHGVPLQTSETQLLKLVVYVPAGYEDQVAEALFGGGAGQLGAYDRCSFRSDGVGTFRPGAGTEPFIGEIGKNERVREIRLETILPAELAQRVVEKMLKAHPYEEIAYDLIPLRNRRPNVGLGRIGRLNQPTTLAAFAATVQQALGATSLRMVGKPETRIAKVAVCGGSGAFLWADAQRQGADVLVTGDVKYHEAQSALARGITLIDAGHFATEALMVKELATTLRQEAGRRGLTLEFIETTTDRDPFSIL